VNREASSRSASLADHNPFRYASMGAPVTQVNEDRPTPLDEDRLDSQRVGGQLRQAKKHGAPAQVIAAYQSTIATDKAERALRKILDAAPPLSAEQVAHLRAIVQTYAPVEP